MFVRGRGVKNSVVCRWGSMQMHKRAEFAEQGFGAANILVDETQILVIQDHSYEVNRELLRFWQELYGQVDGLIGVLLIIGTSLSVNHIKAAERGVS
jgi:hypothetical protein